MEQVTEAEALAEVHRHTVGNRQEIESSKFAGCVSCCATFKAKDVRDWRDEWTSPETDNRVKRWTAKCPRCGQPPVIGSATGLLNDQGYLSIINELLARQTSKRR